ncbi:MAG TPA: IclR family transcriptional regulator [Arthrobacter sp.]|nr:IclR family transcriptional regulator [Arthrobacter sp.]
MNSKTETATGTGSDSKGASVIENTIAVLRCFSSEAPLLGVTEIAPVVGLHKSTVSRILAALERENIVERDSTSRRYRLGLGIIALAGPLLADMDVRRAAYPILQELSETTGETSALLVWNGTEAISVEQVPSRHEVKHTSYLGTRYNTAASSSVQVFLAAEDEQQVRKLLEGGVVAGVSGESAVDAYLDLLHQVSKRGYAVNYGETSPQEVGVAAPVQDHRGTTVAAVLTPAPKFRISKDDLETIGQSCVRAARQITLRLGGK